MDIEPRVIDDRTALIKEMDAVLEKDTSLQWAIVLPGTITIPGSGITVRRSRLMTPIKYVLRYDGHCQCEMLQLRHAKEEGERLYREFLELGLIVVD